MNNTEFPVYPNVKRSVNICKARILILEFNIFESVRVAVYLLNEFDAVMDSTQFVISGDEYAQWGTQDDYLVKLLKKKIQEKYTG